MSPFGADPRLRTGVLRTWRHLTPERKYPQNAPEWRARSGELGETWPDARRSGGGARAGTLEGSQASATLGGRPLPPDNPTVGPSRILAEVAEPARRLPIAPSQSPACTNASTPSGDMSFPSGK